MVSCPGGGVASITEKARFTWHGVDSYPKRLTQVLVVDESGLLVYTSIAFVGWGDHYAVFHSGYCLAEC